MTGRVLVFFEGLGGDSRRMFVDSPVSASNRNGTLALVSIVTSGDSVIRRVSAGLGLRGLGIVLGNALSRHRLRVVGLHCNVNNKPRHARHSVTGRLNVSEDCISQVRGSTLRGLEQEFWGCFLWCLWGVVV